MLGAGALGGPRGMVWGGRREEGSGWGTHVYLWRIHFNIWQNQYNIVKFKNKIFLKSGELEEKEKKKKCLKKGEMVRAHSSGRRGLSRSKFSAQPPGYKAESGEVVYFYFYFNLCVFKHMSLFIIPYSLKKSHTFSRSEKTDIIFSKLTFWIFTVFI